VLILLFFRPTPFSLEAVSISVYFLLKCYSLSVWSSVFSLAVLCWFAGINFVRCFHWLVRPFLGNKTSSKKHCKFGSSQKAIHHQFKFQLLFHILSSKYTNMVSKSPHRELSIKRPSPVSTPRHLPRDMYRQNLEVCWCLPFCFCPQFKIIYYQSSI